MIWPRPRARSAGEATRGTAIGESSLAPAPSFAQWSVGSIELDGILPKVHDPLDREHDDDRARS
jgi:hypothetical protein